MNEVLYSARAARQLRKLAVADSAVVRRACRDLQHMPACANVRALTHHACQYRLRVGNYRVFFDFDGAAHIVSIEEVKKRNERTYR